MFIHMLRLPVILVTSIVRVLFGLVCWILMCAAYSFAAAMRHTIQFVRYIKATTHPYHRLDALQRSSAYAVITGATDGIGYAFARFLYLRGWNVLLIGRSAVKLDMRRNELRDAYRLFTKSTSIKSSSATNNDTLPDLKTLVVDFERVDLNDYKALQAQLNDLEDVALLINNVGMNTEAAQHFQDMTPHVMSDMLAVNQNAAMQLTHMLLQQRRALIQEERIAKMPPCLILNISSASSLLPACPSMSVYAATKAFMNTWSDALRVELCCLPHCHYEEEEAEYDWRNELDFLHTATHQCVDAVTRVETLTPFFITTKLSGVQQSTWTTPDAATYAASALKYINVFDSWAGYWPHSVLRFILTRLVPTSKLLPYIDQMLHAIKPTTLSSATETSSENAAISQTGNVSSL